jgi:hypothetical protein
MVIIRGLNKKIWGRFPTWLGVSPELFLLREKSSTSALIDIKYTSLFDDKFNEYGWHTESLVYKSKLLLQPIHYKFLMSQLSGVENMPFYFFIFSAKDPEKAKIIKVNIQEEHINLHGSITIPKMLKYVDYHFKNPEALEPRPSFLRCKECAFNDNCDKKTTVPLIEEIHY